MASAFLLLVSVLAVAVAVAEAPPCSEQLVWLSPCLAYVASPPNNLAETASGKCCDAFSSSAVNSLCLCDLLRDPPILGFPLNTTRLLSLSSLCLSPSTTSLCAASPALPPLNSAGITASPHVTAAGSRSGSRSRGAGRPSPRTRRGGGTAFHSHSPNDSTSTLTRGYNTLLLLAIFVTPALLNTLQY